MGAKGIEMRKEEILSICELFLKAESDEISEELLEQVAAVRY